jgi:hypothetical protein
MSLDFVIGLQMAQFRPSSGNYDHGGHLEMHDEGYDYDGVHDDAAGGSYGTFEDYVPSEPNGGNNNGDGEEGGEGDEGGTSESGPPPVPEPPDIDFEAMRIANRDLNGNNENGSVSDDDSDDDGVQEFLVRPARTNAIAYRIDPLPQPYRMIDEIVQRLVRRAADLGSSCAAAHPGKRAMDVLRGRPPLDLTSPPLPPPPASGTPTAYPQSLVEWRQFGRITASISTPGSDGSAWIIGNDHGFVFFIDLARTLTVTAQIRLPLGHDAIIAQAASAAGVSAQPDDYNAITSIQCGIVNPVEDVEVVNNEYRVLICVGGREVYMLGLDTMTPHFIEGCVLRPPISNPSSLTSASGTSAPVAMEKTPRARANAAATKTESKKATTVVAATSGSTAAAAKRASKSKGDTSARGNPSMDASTAAATSLLLHDQPNSIISMILSQDTFYVSLSLADGTLLVYDIREARRKEEFRATTPDTEPSSPTRDNNNNKNKDNDGPNSTSFGRGGRGPGIVGREMVLECRLVLRIPLPTTLAALWIKQRALITAAAPTLNSVVNAPPAAGLSRSPSSLSTNSSTPSNTSASPVAHVHFLRVMCERKISAPTTYATRGLLVWWTGDSSYHRYHLPNAQSRAPTFIVDVPIASVPIPSTSSRSSLPSTLPTISSKPSKTASGTRNTAVSTAAQPTIVECKSFPRPLDRHVQLLLHETD